MKKIDSEIFVQFLKDNNFYDAWIEGYNLDNEIYDDIVPLEEFFRTIHPLVWLYSGPAAMAMLSSNDIKNNKSSSIAKRYSEWRDKYLSDYIRLDEKWMDFVWNNS